MITWLSRLSLLVFLGGFTLPLLSAPEPTLKVGGAAPALQTGKWIQGEAVKAFERDKVYIVEFWATWCGPCRSSIPHLNELHEKFKDKGLVVIGQNVWEQEEAKVPDFVKSMGEKMTYRVALDLKKDADDRGRMAETWMQAAGQSGIPAAFVVDKAGLVAWIGHPMTLTAALLEQVLVGTFDVKKAAAEMEAQQKKEAQLQTLWQEFQQAMEGSDWAKAEKAISDAALLLPEEARDALAMSRIAIHKGKGDLEGAAKLSLEVSERNLDNAMLQNQLAWELATTDGLDKAGLEKAHTIAVRASKASEGKDPGILDTLARVLFRQGKKAEAIQTQEKAIQLATGEQEKAQLTKTLEAYKGGSLPR